MANSQMTAPVICRLGSDAVPELADIEATANIPPWSAKLFAQEFQNECARIYGARQGGKVAGFLVLHVVIDEAHILNIAVKTDLRGHGIGRAMLEEVLGELSVAQVKWVTLEVRRSNVVARTLYESLGFFEIGVRPRYYTSNQEDALLLKLDLISFQADRCKPSTDALFSPLGS